MLKLDLGRLSREGRLRIEAEVPADDPLWAETGLTFAGPVVIKLVAMEAGSGEVVVRGQVRASVAQKCRRCLDPVEREVDEELTIVFRTAAEEDGTEEDGEIRVIDPSANEIELGDAVREEMVLSIESFVVCREDCRGLCPLCGTDLNENECDCTLEEPDPRWEALRALKPD